MASRCSARRPTRPATCSRSPTACRASCRIDREPCAVDEFLRRGRGVPVGQHREQPLATSDWGIVGLDDTRRRRLLLPVRGARRRRRADGAAGSIASSARRWRSPRWCNIAILAIGWIFGGPADDALDIDPPPSTAIAKILLEPPKEPEPEKKPQPRKVREEDASKRAREKEGKIGNHDAKVAETKIPKGDKDQIVKKVSNVGLLGAVKASQAVGGAQDAAVGHAGRDHDDGDGGPQGHRAGHRQAASGGMSTRGEGPGGGGKGDGQLLGVGTLAVGGGGHGAHNTGNGPGPRRQGDEGRRADRHARTPTAACPRSRSSRSCSRTRRRSSSATRRSCSASRTWRARS